MKVVKSKTLRRDEIDDMAKFYGGPRGSVATVTEAWDFGNARGWKLVGDFIHPEELLLRHTPCGELDRPDHWQDYNPLALPSPMNVAWDHPFYYRDRETERAAAIAVHLYGWQFPSTQQHVREFARKSKLNYSLPDEESWWYPGWTKLVLYTSKWGPEPSAVSKEGTKEDKTQ